MCWLEGGWERLRGGDVYDSVMLEVWGKLSLRLRDVGAESVRAGFSLGMAALLSSCWFNEILVNDGELVK